MTSEDRTVPIEGSPRFVRALRLEVLSGPDLGKRCDSDSDVVSVGTADGNHLTLTDPTVSRFHVELRRDERGILLADVGSTNGTRIGPALVRSASVGLEPGSTIGLGATRLRVDDGDVVAVGGELETFGELRAESPAMKRLFATAEKLATSEVPVLLFGESGTGKELLARALHDSSPRSEGPFVTVDCGAITPTLFSSELFGHERGAFTGAERQHLGAFERAHGGSLFLDELGELPAELQPALLGALERGKIRRVGGQKDVEVDVRLISATHRDLRTQVNDGSFRLDLFYRVAVVLLRVPPLRERATDIPYLIQHFLREAGAPKSVNDLFDADSLTRLSTHPFPGNVRELKNLVLGTLALGEAPSMVDVPLPSAATDAFAPLFDLPYRDAKRRANDEFERRYVEHWLARTGGNIRQASRDAMMDRSYLMELIRRHHLK
jgi:DNA-binding NtrC family response regulator